MAGPLFVTERSAFALTSVEAVDELLLGFESGVVDVTLAVFITIVPFVSEPLNVTVTLNVADAPAAKVAIEQVTVAPVVQVNVGPFVCDSETNVVPAGRVSVSVTEAAFEGPRFWSVIVYVTFEPASAALGALFATLRSALDDTVAKGRDALASTSDEHLMTPWRLLVAGRVVMEQPRHVVLSDTFTHLAHHRGQLTVYLRLNDVPVPAIYGPSADEGS